MIQSTCTITIFTLIFLRSAWIIYSFRQSTCLHAFFTHRWSYPDSESLYLCSLAKLLGNLERSICNSSVATLEHFPAPPLSSLFQDFLLSLQTFLDHFLSFLGFSETWFQANCGMAFFRIPDKPALCLVEFQAIKLRFQLNTSACCRNPNFSLVYHRGFVLCA